MAGQYRIKRRTHQINLTENNVVTVDLPRGYDYESLFFRLTGAANVTTAGSAVRALAPNQLIKRIEIVADGKNTIASVPFWHLSRCAKRSQMGLLTPPSGFAIASYNIEATGVLDQCLIDGVRPKDSNLRTSGMSLLQLRITTGALVDMFTGSPAGSMTTFGLDVFTSEVVELADPKTGAVTQPLYIQKRAYQDIAIPASNANQQVILPVGNALRGVTILATINGEPSNAVLNNVQMASGVDVRVNLPAADLQRMNALDYDALGILSGTTGAASSTQMPTGMYEVDMMRNGGSDVKVTDAWDLTGASEAKLILDVTGGSGYQITVVTTEFIQ